MSNFNHIARFYDLLEKLTFGSRLTIAKKHLINSLKPGREILIIGGGTGDILNDFFNKPPYPQIDFYEPSNGMISRAKKNLQMPFKNYVHFIEEGYPNFTLHKEYDVIVAFFLLDMFTNREAMDLMQKMNASLKPGGTWLVADFFPAHNLFQKIITQIMYIFFKLTTGISAGKLPDYDLLFSKNHSMLSDEKIYSGGWIRARIYKKIN